MFITTDSLFLLAVRCPIMLFTFIGHLSLFKFTGIFKNLCLAYCYTYRSIWINWEVLVPVVLSFHTMWCVCIILHSQRSLNDNTTTHTKFQCQPLMLKQWNILKYLWTCSNMSSQMYFCAIWSISNMNSISFLLMCYKHAHQCSKLQYIWLAVNNTPFF